MGSYWMLVVRSPKTHDLGRIGKQPTPKHGWLETEPFTPDEDTEAWEFQLIPSESNELSDFFPPVIPLMSERLVTALRGAGVTTLDAFPITLLNTKGNKVTERFFAVHITSQVFCADLAASDCDVEDPDDPVFVDFDSLVIDEARAEGNTFFRLGESLGGIVVHDSVKEALESQPWRGVTFIKPKDWIGG